MTDEPDDLREKLKLLEGDRNAFEASSRAITEGNKKKIVALRRENKQLIASVRDLKNPGKRKHGAGVGEKALEVLDQKVSVQIKKYNMVRAEGVKKEKQLEVLQKKRIEVHRQLEKLNAHERGVSTETSRMNELENKFERARIREQEARAICNTYNKIIKQLQKERLSYDNEVTELEAMLKLRSEELEQCGTLCRDAFAAKDKAKKDLSLAEKEAAASRATREAEKKRLNAIADEQRKKYEAMERRLRNTSVQSREENGENEEGETIKKMESYEEAMRRIQDATGVADIHDVVTRYYAQGESKAYLEEMRVKNAALLETLRDEHNKVSKEFESLKYSGEARVTSNQRMLAEFEQHLTEAETRRNKAANKLKFTTSQLLKVKTGIDHLHDKLETLKPVKHRAANTVDTKLEEAQLRLVELAKELEQRKAERPSTDEFPIVVPEHNTRIQIKNEEEEGKQDDTESEDEFVISRDQIKKQAQTLVDSKNTKVKRKKKGRY